MIEMSEQPPGGEPGEAALGGWFRALGLFSVPGPKAWLGTVGRHEIRVVTRGLLRARLYIDGDCRDTRSPVLAANRNVPLLSARVPSREPTPIIVEVYSRGWCAGRIEVRAAGRPIALSPVAPQD